MELQKLLMEMQKQGCFFVITYGEWSDYMIEAVFGGWLQTVEYFRGYKSDEKRIEVWKHDKKIGVFTEEIVKKTWDVNGATWIERGLKYEGEEDFIQGGVQG